MAYKTFDYSLYSTVDIKQYIPSALTGRSQGSSLWVRFFVDGPTFGSGLKLFGADARLLTQFDPPSLAKSGSGKFITLIMQPCRCTAA